MKRKEEISKAAEKELKDCPYISTSINTSLIGFDFFIKGAEWADSHPHWISVEDEMPPRWDTNPNVSVPVITCKFVNKELQYIDLQRYVFGNSKWQYGDATHWMPFQFPEKGGEHE